MAWFRERGAAAGASAGGTLDGPAAEALAQRHLERRGLRTVTRNYRCRGGEIDLVMLDRGSLVFVEVRFRTSRRYGRAEETVGPRKQARLIHAARHYLQQSGDSRPARFDVVAIHPAATGPDIHWIRDAFTA